MSKTTPGPWKIDGFWKGAFEIISPHASVRGARLVICARNEHELRETEMLANARLIAAAPDLLVALQGLLRWIPVYPAAADGISGGRAAHADAIANARAAIARATGEGA